MESPANEIKKLSHWGKFVRFVFRLLSLFVISSYLLSYLSSHFTPSVFMFFSVLGLFFLPLLILFLFAAIVMAFRKEWKWLIAFGLCFLFSLPDLLSFFNAHFMFCLFLIAQTYTKLVKKVSRLCVILKFTRRESIFKSIDYQQFDIFIALSSRPIFIYFDSGTSKTTYIRRREEPTPSEERKTFSESSLFDMTGFSRRTFRTAQSVSFIFF